MGVAAERAARHRDRFVSEICSSCQVTLRLIGHKYMHGSKRLIAVVVLSFFTCSCNQDLRRLPAGYSLERFSEGPTHYYVLGPSAESEHGGGAFNGIILEIGWNEDWILARVKRNDGQPNGWYVLNPKTKKITGPFDEAQLKSKPELSNIKIRKPASFFW